MKQSLHGRFIVKVENKSDFINIISCKDVLLNCIQVVENTEFISNQFKFFSNSIN